MNWPWTRRAKPSIDLVELEVEQIAESLERLALELQLLLASDVGDGR